MGAGPGPSQAVSAAGLSIIIISSGSSQMRQHQIKGKPLNLLPSPRQHRAALELASWSCDNPPIDLLHRVQAALGLLGRGLKMLRNVCQSLQQRVPYFMKLYAGRAPLCTVLSIFLQLVEVVSLHASQRECFVSFFFFFSFTSFA